MSMTPTPSPLLSPTPAASRHQPAEGYLRTLIGRAFPDFAGDFHLAPLLGDASDRRYYRLRFSTPINDVTSVVLMQLATPYTLGELPFSNVQRFLASKGVPVPAIFYDDAPHGFIVLEDLGDLTLEAALSQAHEEDMAQWYREAIDVLLVIQEPTTTPPHGSCIAFHLAFDVEKLMWELDFFLTYMLEQLCSAQFKPAAKATLRAYFREIATLLAQQPRVLTHRDYHSRNLMRHRDHLRVIDFQDARLGPCQYDLASLLFDSYVVLPHDLRQALLQYYLERTAQGAGTRDIEEFLRVFDYMCLQRNLKALGTFAFQITVKKNQRYAPAIPTTLGYIQQHLAMHPELQGLQELLESSLFAALPAALQAAGTHTPGKSPTH